MSKDTIDEIRSSLERYKGRRVSLHAVGDRNRVLNTVGVLDGVYSDIFTIFVHNESYDKRYCYTYSEILTKNVRVDPVADLA